MYYNNIGKAYYTYNSKVFFTKSNLICTSYFELSCPVNMILNPIAALHEAQIKLKSHLVKAVLTITRNVKIALVQMYNCHLIFTHFLSEDAFYSQLSHVSNN